MKISEIEEIFQNRGFRPMENTDAGYQGNMLFPCSKEIGFRIKQHLYLDETPMFLAIRSVVISKCLLLIRGNPNIIHTPLTIDNETLLPQSIWSTHYHNDISLPSKRKIASNITSTYQNREIPNGVFLPTEKVNAEIKELLFF